MDVEYCAHWWIRIEKTLPLVSYISRFTNPERYTWVEALWIFDDVSLLIYIVLPSVHQDSILQAGIKDNTLFDSKKQKRYLRFLS